MRRHLVAAALAVATLFAGTPADAVCQGCGGALVTMGVADAATIAQGRDPKHVLKASCTYTTPAIAHPLADPTYTGLLAVTGTGSKAPGSSDPRVDVTCRVRLQGGAWYLTDGSGIVHAESAEAVPGNSPVEVLCLTATAIWYVSSGSDTATIDWCVGPGASIATGGDDLRGTAG